MQDNSAQHPADRKGHKEDGIARSSLVVACMTFISRILGLIRTMVIAAFFADGAEADAFFVAFKIPNFLRRLFAEGAFSQAFVPILSEYRHKKSFAEVRELIDHVTGRLAIILLVISVLGIIGAPVVATVFAPGYLDNPQKFDLVVDILRLTFPYILLISLTGLAGGILNTYGRFAVPAVTPVFLNLSLIACAVLLSPLMAEPIMALAWGVLLAGIIQLMFQLPFLQHLRLLPRPRLHPEHEGVKRIIALMIPVLFSVSVSQINLLVDTILATSIEGDGSLSWLNYADRLMELPLAVFGIAIATVILPSLSRNHSNPSPEYFSATLDWGLRAICLLGMPALVALVYLAEPLVITLYQRGAFTADSVLQTARALQAYSLGLLAFMAIKVLASAYFSRQDTRTPVRYGVIAMLSNIVFNLLLIIPLAHVGLALATSLSGFINAGLLLYGLIRLGVFSFMPGWGRFSLQLLLANTAMLAFLVFFNSPVAEWLAWGEGVRLLQVAFLCCGGALSYGLVLYLLGMRFADFRR